MAELLPEQLHQTSSTLTTTNVVIIPEAAHRRKKRQILDIDSWVQVYTIYMLALRPYHPEYPAWLHYDTEFRRWAAANQYTQWSQIHPQFYAFAFNGREIAAGQIDGGNHIYYSSPSIQPPPLSILISTVCSYCSISLKLSTLLIH